MAQSGDVAPHLVRLTVFSSLIPKNMNKVSKVSTRLLQSVVQRVVLGFRDVERGGWLTPQARRGETRRGVRLSPIG